MQQTQQGTFARTISAHQGHALARCNMQGDGFQRSSGVGAPTRQTSTIRPKLDTR
jgi:hypothetical protein